MNANTCSFCGVAGDLVELGKDGTCLDAMNCNIRSLMEENQAQLAVIEALREVIEGLRRGTAD